MDKVKFVSNYIVYGSNDLELTPNFVHVERIENSKLKNRGEISPHLHSNIFQIIYVSKGRIIFSELQNEIIVEQGTFITIPENTLHAIKFNKKTHGFVITISQLLFYNLFEYNYQVPESFQGINFLDSGNEKDYLHQLLNKLESQLMELLEPHEITVRSILSLIIKELYHLSLKDNGVKHKQLKVVDFHFTKFIKLIRQKSAKEKKLQVYANELGITTTHLNRLCKQAVGKTASMVIQDYIILEAKRYLSFTTHNIAEIAYMLEFSAPSYFNRYFKKLVGVTPRMYRVSYTSSAK